MKRSLIGILLLVLAAGCGRRPDSESPPPPAPSAPAAPATGADAPLATQLTGDERGQAIVRKMLQTYRGLRSYREEVTRTVLLTGPGQPRRMVGKLRVAYRAPNRFYFDVTDKKLLIAMASDGERVRALNPGAKVMLSTDAPTQLVGSAGFLDKLEAEPQYVMLAFVIDPEAVSGAVTSVATERLKDHPVDRVSISQADNVDLTLWISQKDHLLRQLQLVASAARNGQIYRQKILQTYTGIELNPALPDKTFQLAKPAGVREQSVVALVGRPSPPFKLKTLDGKTVDLAAERGRVVVLNFWAHWCPACKMEFPMMRRVAEEAQARGVRFYGVTLKQEDDTDWQKTRGVIEEYRLPFPTLIDDAGGATKDYAVEGLPLTVVIDRGGIVRAELSGAQDEAALKSALRKAGA
jgi:cytochrome c biogenesis protein CcmG/thiol:disulfide interchange protein DsbE